MNTFLRLYVRLRERNGQSMSEYALLMAAIAIVALVTFQSLGNNVSTLVNNVSNKL